MIGGVPFPPLPATRHQPVPLPTGYRGATAPVKNRPSALLADSDNNPVEPALSLAHVASRRRAVSEYGGQDVGPGKEEDCITTARGKLP